MRVYCSISLFVFKNKNYIALNYLLLAILATFLFSCSSTRYVPEDKYLLNDIDIEVDNPAINKDVLSGYLRQKENLKILKMTKFHLHLYNLSRKSKENGWLKRIGEAPVIFDRQLTNKSVEQFEQYLKNRGYYNARVTSDIRFKKKKAWVTYKIETEKPYRVRNITYNIKDDAIAKIYMKKASGALIHKNSRLDVELLEKERSRITNIMQNEGYFMFADEYIHYQVDSALNNNQADVEMIIENDENRYRNSINKHRKFVVDYYEIYVDDAGRDNLISASKYYSDTTIVGGFIFYHNGKIPLDTKLLIKNIEIKPGQQYVKDKETKTYNNFYSLRQFKYVNVQFDELLSRSDSVHGVLAGKIILPMQVKQSYSVDIEGTNTSGNLGVAGGLNYQHRNLLRGAETFNLNFKGATERQVTIVNDVESEFMMQELGAEATISVPGFVFPIKESKLKLYSMPKTDFSVAYNYQRRPDYTRTIANARFGYQFKTNAFVSHIINPIDFNVVRLSDVDNQFLESIRDLYIKSSYTDHVISSLNYSFSFNNKNLKKTSGYLYFRFNAEFAGNGLMAYSQLTNREQKVITDNETGVTTSYYELFNTRFAQYVKSDFDFRYGRRFDRVNSMAFRFFSGVGLPYGNFNVMPFEKRYFTGGANGIRAWQVRSLGPGSYVAASDEYPNQSADIKIESNIEYRFKLVSLVEGALFLDAGNIWAINDMDNREGAVFRLNEFYKQIAVGTGFGLRIVSNYFILRADVGLKLCDPSQNLGARWIPGNRQFNGDDFNFNIAIGYPF